MSPAVAEASPSTKQLRYLRSLALQTATTFVAPTSRRQAGSEIARLTKLRERGAAPNFEDLPDGQESFAYATTVAPDEVTGFGANTSWSHRSAPSIPAPPPSAQVGERTELARYIVADSERVIYGQRINGHVRVTDRPASGSGRSYLVERELERDGYAALKALVTDYLAQARALDAVPMAASAVPSTGQCGG